MISAHLDDYVSNTDAVILIVPLRKVSEKIGN